MMNFKMIIGLSAMLFALGCTKKQEVAPAEVAPQATAAKVWTVGSDAAYAPFEIENADKSITGFDIDVIKAIAAKNQIEVKIINTPWEGLFTQLDSGDRDILISAITITDERKNVMDFSDPYFEAVQWIAVGEKSKIEKFAQLKDKKVGVQTGTTGDEVVSKLLGKTNSNIKRFESTPLALQELVAGGVEAVVADNGVVANFVSNNADKKMKIITDSSFAKEFYGMAVRKGNAELLAKINKGLAEIKADGTYQKIYDQYFGASAAK